MTKVYTPEEQARKDKVRARVMAKMSDADKAFFQELIDEKAATRLRWADMSDEEKDAW